MELSAKHLTIVLTMIEDKFAEITEAVMAGNATHTAFIIKDLGELAELGIIIKEVEKSKRDAKAKRGKRRPALKKKTSSRKKKKTSKTWPPAAFPPRAKLTPNSVSKEAK